MASQKPPVALVRSVTLIFSFAAALALADAAAVAAALALADGAAVGAALLPHAATSIAAAPSTPSAFSRVDMCVAPSCRIVLVGSAARAVRPGGAGSNGGAPSGTDDPGHELLLVVRGRGRLADLAAAAHDHRPVGDRHHVIHAVRDQDDRVAEGSEPMYKLQASRRLLKPQGCSRLVEDHELRLVRHGSRDGDRL